MIEMAKEECQVQGLIDGGVSNLQYADDTILLMKHDLDQAVNMKLILSIFENYRG
jgi:hypothetical protein